MKELDFCPGIDVEVNIDPDNSPDVWFPAIFIRKVTNESFLVEYRSRETGLQEVSVDFGHIRPSPPQLSNNGFSLLEKVDAFHDFCWSSGVVTKILADGRYIVYFKRTKKEKELSRTDMRLQMECINGKWVNSSQDSSLTLVSGNGKQMDSGVNDEHVREEENDTVTLKRSHRLSRTTDSENEDNKSKTPGNARIKESGGDAVTRLLKSDRRMNEKKASDAPFSPQSCKLRLKLTDMLQNGESSVLDSSPIGNAGKSSSKHCEDNNQSSNPTGKMGDNEHHSAPRKRGRPPKREKSPNIQSVEDGIALPNMEKSSELQSLEQDIVEETRNKSLDILPLGSIVVGLTHTGKMIETAVSGSSGLHLKGESSKVMKDEEKHSNTEANHESAGSEPQKDGEVTTLKKKRGRPFKDAEVAALNKKRGRPFKDVEVLTLKKKRGRPFKDAQVATLNKKRGRPVKVLFRVGRSTTKEAEHVVMEGKDYVSDIKETINEVENPATVTESAGISNANSSSGVSRRRRRKIVNNPIRKLITANSSERVLKNAPKSPEEMNTIEVSEPVKPVTLGKGRRQKPIKQVETPTEDSGDHLSENGAKVLDNGVAGNVETLTRTLSNVSDDDMPLSAWFEGGHSSPTTHGRLDDNAPEREDHALRQSTAIVSVDSQELPFVKTSLIWSMIESMEVIKRIPQKPHFRPLYNCKEECREGLAIGNMVTFTSLVDRISRLQFDNLENVLHGYLEALAELEEHGFNVGPVRDRLNTLMSIKGKYEQMVELDDQKLKIEEEIEEIDKKIAELNKKRGLATSKRETNDAEMRLLMSSMDTAKGCLESSKEQFEKVANSSW